MRECRFWRSLPCAAASAVMWSGCSRYLACEFDALEGETECEQFRLADRCLEQFYAPFFLWGLFDQQSFPAVPRGLQFVLDHREEYQTDDHPLKDIAVGTPVGDIEQLDGCWGRFEPFVLSDASGQWVEAEFIRIDLDNGTVHSEYKDALEGHPCSDDTRPYFFDLDEQIVSSDEHMIFLSGVDDSSRAHAAGLNPDGSTSFHLGAELSWEFSVSEYEKRYTVDGDYLATSSNAGRDFDPLTAKDLWFRIDCGSVGGDQ